MRSEYWFVTHLHRVDNDLIMLNGGQSWLMVVNIVRPTVYITSGSQQLCLLNQ